MWAVIVKLALGGFNILKLIGGGIASVARSLNAQGWIGLGVALLLTYGWVHQRGEARHWRKQSDRYEALYHGEQAAFVKTVANYRAAAEAARKSDAANAARVVAEQTNINQRSSHDYEARIAAARAAAADRLSRNHATAAAHPGGGATAPVSGLPAAPGEPDQAAGQDRLSADDALTATEQAIQLDELIKWVTSQHAVDVNGNAARH